MLISVRRNVEAKRKSTGLEDVHLVHQAIPEVDLDSVDTTTIFLGKKISAPILISAMTGGFRGAVKINKMLGRIAEKHKVAIGVGSQRSALESLDDKEIVESYAVVRQEAPSVPILANIGVPQLLKERNIDAILKIVDMIQADALAVHLNPLQEAVQPEGEAVFAGALKAIEELASSLSKPIVVKETGAGISKEVAKALDKIEGVEYIDVGGAGGTSFAAVEYYRALKARNKRMARLGLTFWNWGMPTAISLLEVLSATSKKVIASGGIRSGVEIAKCIALGASMAGIARPFLKILVKEGLRGLDEYLSQLKDELRITMFLTGSRRISDLYERDVVITGFVREWLEQRGIDLREVLKRRRNRIGAMG